MHAQIEIFTNLGYSLRDWVAVVIIFLAQEGKLECTLSPTEWMYCLNSQIAHLDSEEMEFKGIGEHDLKWLR